MSINKKGEIIVAVDVPTFEEASKIVDSLVDKIDIFKIGSQLFTACGPFIIRYVAAKGKKIFLDLKFHDIPNTVANAVTASVNLNKAVFDLASEDDKRIEISPDAGIFMLTVHTLGGEEMLKRAVEAAESQAKELGVLRPKIVGITVLTSDVKTENVAQIVLERATLAKKCGLDGVVASSCEAAMIRKELGEDFIIITPGIRPSGADAGDQKRVTTPSEAIKNGSNFLVIGRPIVKADDLAVAAENILKEINNL
ncbi:MAG: orotidine-5'-phosphate decarboxylase [Candidatus Zapsychrus exili]|nr:orotidine-5'-phosphate decarboxylase [Candidatus Zapsychrus exili]